MRKAKYAISLYLRLSQEDDRKDESNSIKHQREMVRDFIANHDDFKGNVSLVEYVDDGESGTHTYRKAYQRLMADVARGDIDCIIVKDA